MFIHEYQGKILLKKYGVPTVDGGVAFSVDEAVEVAKKLNTPIWVVKAQIHAGGRGKAGGVKLAKTIDEVRANASEILGKTLVTHQTTEAGQLVRRLYIESGCDIQKEYYLSALVDRANAKVSFIASSEGGVEIEEVAEKTPEAIIKVSVGVDTGLQPCHVRKLGYGIGLSKDQVKEFSKVVVGIYNMLMEKDASQVEINPLVKTGDDKFIALDAKVNFDGNALYRHPDIVEFRDLDEEDPSEVQASKFDLNYVKLDGSIGCMVNGAGLAMATMDIIKLYGEEPANFLDVGGGATKEKVTEAFKIITSDKNVKGILVNIFGGIMRCDIIAEGVIAAAKDIQLNVPLVVRLEGTNVELGKDILSKSGLNIISADNLDDAAKKITECVKVV
jgi:succinyl-CoA synthetase beta subunit